ncbi:MULTISPECIES: hypothetical protein [unclassified Ensifer]|uniref:hypothetical protein n=1 Tax=unclassified Ensifer TaxID=2633371 RepID=UPI000813CEF1|nr:MULTISPECIES: hypothetical protein [unclassified Ensifer]OCP17362.1 hypothetical protein BC361_07835 [Ensifer sp. LC54]OCP28733.1 hypothetical protein BC363_02525 [Ensifer sp. LC384]
MGEPILRFTLDTNCLIDIDEARPAGGDVLALVDAARRGAADVAILASSASEQQPGGAHLDSFAAFQARMIDLGLGDIALLKPIAKYGLSFWDFALIGDEASVERERQIFEALFPGTPSDWPTYASANGLDPEDLFSRPAWKWRNRLCDVQAIWSHLNDERDFFVTRDKNFRRLNRTVEFAHAISVTPAEAVALLSA